LSLLGPNIFLSILSSKTLSLYSSLSVRHFHNHTKQHVKLFFCTFESFYFCTAKWKTNGLHRLVANMKITSNKVVTLNVFVTFMIISYKQTMCNTPEEQKPRLSVSTKLTSFLWT
jgi:hypothetical protein